MEMPKEAWRGGEGAMTQLIPGVLVNIKIHINTPTHIWNKSPAIEGKLGGGGLLIWIYNWQKKEKSVVVLQLFLDSTSVGTG